jgi:mannitol/fructose-specific phosphotransferase system IIA component (Ntr-type)
MVGDSPSLRERTRVVIHRFVTNVFAPVFFASLGLRVDFVRHFDARLCVLVFSIATVTKVLGCAFGARAGGLTWREASAVGFGLNARGAMGIILALLALDAGLLKEEVFVALVMMAIATSLLSGPAMNRLLYRAQEEDVVQLLRRGAFVPRLATTTASGAIDELVESLRPLLASHLEVARTAVKERELVAHTGLGDEVALPHAAVEGLTRPLLALGLAPGGIDFDAMDGKAAKIVFLLLMPPRAYEEEVRVLASISRSVFDEAARRELLSAAGLDHAARCLSENATRIAKANPRPRAASIVDL